MTTDQELSPEAIASAEAAMRDAGVPTHEVVQVDYFGFEETHVVNLPDGKSWVEHKTLTEGQRRKYLNGINRDVVISRSTGDAKMQMQPGDERYTLLLTALTGWNLVRNGNPIPFNPSNVKLFLESAPPKIIDVIDKEVRKVNAWLIEDMSVEDIDKEIANLQELRAVRVEEEAKK